MPITMLFFLIFFSIFALWFEWFCQFFYFFEEQYLNFVVYSIEPVDFLILSNLLYLMFASWLHGRSFHFLECKSLGFNVLQFFSLDDLYAPLCSTPLFSSITRYWNSIVLLLYFIVASALGHITATLMKVCIKARRVSHGL